MNNIDQEFLNFKPDRFYFRSRTQYLSPLENEEVKEIEIKEKKHDILGHIIAGVGGLGLFGFFLININRIEGAETLIVKIFLFVLSLLLCSASLLFLYDNFKKVFNSENIGKVSVDSCGIKLNNNLIEWDNIKNATIKTYKTSGGANDAFILILTKSGKIVDMDISLLYDSERTFFPDREYLKLRKGIGYYLKKN